MKTVTQTPPHPIAMKPKLLLAFVLRTFPCLVAGTTPLFAAEYTWTGGDGANDATWQNPLNWADNAVPNGVAGQLSTSSATDVVVFDSETAPFMPSDSILTRNSWTGSFKNPQIQVLNGQVNFTNNLNWGWNTTTLTVGDGDMTTLAVANTGYTGLNRDPGGLKTYVVNADGTLIFRNNVAAWSDDGSSKKAVVSLAGGTVRFDGTINARFTDAANNYVSFDASASTFTATFGGQLPNMASVQGQFGDSFRLGGALASDPDARLVASDNGNGTFTVSITTEPPPLDATPPAISSLNPANGANGISPSANLELSFDEPIAVATGFITLKNLTTASEVQINVTGGTQVSVVGPVLSINPTADLVPGANYAVRIDAGAIVDRATPANTFSGIADDTTWSFSVFSGFYVWTGASGSGSNWYDVGNWQDGLVPTQGTTLGSPIATRIVVFDAETATGGFMPTQTITVASTWSGSAFLMPSVRVLNGTINLTGPGGEWWHYGGANVIQIGDGDMTTAARVNTTFTNWVRHLQNGGKNRITIHADGTLNQSANFQWGQNGDTEMTLNGGTFISSGTIQGLATRAGSLVNFNADGSTFTAPFGGDFADLAAVFAQIGNSFINNTGGVLGARDNGDGTFTVGFLAGTITSFRAAGATGVINQANKTIALEVPFGTDLATLAPTFTLTSGTCNQTSGAIPAPNFAAAPGNTVNYVVTDNTTDPVTQNTYSVTVTVGPEIATLVINLGSNPGTTIEAGATTFIGSGPTNLPLPPMPFGSILRSIAMNVTLEGTDNSNYTNDLAALFDPTPGTPGGDFSLGILSPTPNVDFGQSKTLDWVGGASESDPLTDTKTQADWTGDIDLSSTGLFLGNAYDSSPGTPGDGGTWAGTITLTYEVGSGSSPYAGWSGGEPFGGDKNGDGVSNGLAFLLGAADPDENATGRLPSVEKNAGGLVLTFTCRDAASRGGAVLNVQWSHDLGATDLWSTNFAAVPTPPGGTVNEVVFTVSENGGDGSLDDVVATIQAGKAAGGKLFGRLAGSEN